MDNTEKPHDMVGSATEAPDGDILDETQGSGEDPEADAKQVEEILLGLGFVDTIAKRAHGATPERAETQLLLTEEARRLMRAIAKKLGMTQPAMIEILIREKALEMKIPLWAPSSPDLSREKIFTFTKSRQ